MNKSDFPKEEMAEMMEMMTEKLPAIMKAAIDSIYSTETASKMGAAIATFYKSLIDAGMDKDDAIYLTEEYMASFKSMMNQNQNIGKN